MTELNEQAKDLLRATFNLLNEGEGNAHLEVDGKEAARIMNEITKLLEKN